MKKLALLAALLTLTLTACGNDASTSSPVPTATPTPAPTATPTPTPEPTPTPVATLTWTEQLFTDKFTASDGTVVMTSRTVLPGIVDADTDPAWSAIHQHYTQLGTAALTAATENADWARDDYQLALDSGFDFIPYAQDYSYTLVYQSEAFVSFLRTSYTMLGGAHPNSNQFSDTFDLATGELLTLSQLFTEGWENQLLDAVVAANIALGYDGDYGITAEALRDHFVADFFYLTDEGVVIYYQEGLLGPHALGTVEYTIPYTDLNDILVYGL